MERDKKNTPATAAEPVDKTAQNIDNLLDKAVDGEMPPEVNGPKGPEPTRYGDWEQKGRCTDF
ncbi:DUF1674 domain-containing protein [Alphaproteobacteria bacterium]|nr:DUF1674 domain-containing protein [Alphaproteobacteria bacterium]